MAKTDLEAVLEGYNSVATKPIQTAGNSIGLGILNKSTSLNPNSVFGMMPNNKNIGLGNIPTYNPVTTAVDSLPGASGGFGDWVSNKANGAWDWITQKPSTTVFDPRTGKYVTKEGSLLGSGSNLRGLMDIGFAGLNFMNDRDRLKMEKQALESNLKSAQMQNDLTYDQLAQQVGVQKSLAQAFGAGTQQYDDRLKPFKQYTSTAKA